MFLPKMEFLVQGLQSTNRTDRQTHDQTHYHATSAGGKNEQKAKLISTLETDRTLQIYTTQAMESL